MPEVSELFRMTRSSPKLCEGRLQKVMGLWTPESNEKEVWPSTFPINMYESFKQSWRTHINNLKPCEFGSIFVLCSRCSGFKVTDCLCYLPDWNTSQTEVASWKGKDWMMRKLRHFLHCHGPWRVDTSGIIILRGILNNTELSKPGMLNLTCRGDGARQSPR